jgi:pimeloyl-[acyl-carrier protein] methyl ester esterase
VKDLVLLHGWGIRGAAFGELSQRLRETCAVLPLDLPGYDGPERPEPYTLERLVTHVAARAPRRCTVLGWSLGALIALAWAAAAPAQVEGLVLVGATPCFVQKADWRHGVGPDVFALFAQDVRSDRERALRRFAALCAHGDADVKTVARALQSAIPDSRTALETLQDGLRILLESDLRELLPRIPQPVLLVHGEEDPLATLAAATCMAATLPRAQLERVAGAGHAPFVTHAAPIAERIERFLYG